MERRKARARAKTRARAKARKAGGSKRALVEECLSGRLCVDSADTLQRTYEQFKRPEDPHLSVDYFVEAMRLGKAPGREFAVECELDESPFPHRVDPEAQVGAGPSDHIYKAGDVADGEPLLRDVEVEQEQDGERYFYHAVGDDNPDYVPDHVFRSATTGRAYAYKPDTQHIRNGDTAKSIPAHAPLEMGVDDLWVDPYAEGGHMIEEVSAEHRASFDDFLENELPPIAKARPRAEDSIAFKRDDPTRVIAITGAEAEVEAEAEAEAEGVDIGACAYTSVAKTLTPAYRRHLLTCGQETDFQKLWMWIETHLNAEQPAIFSLRGLINDIRLHSGWPYSIEARDAAALPRHYVLGIKLNTSDAADHEVILSEMGDGSEDHFQTRDSIVGYTIDYLGCTLMLGVDQKASHADFEAVDSIEKAVASRLSVIVCRATFAPMA